MSLIALLKGRGPSGFGYGSSAETVAAGLNLKGKRYLITGCNSGLGYETMRVLASRGAAVIGTARSLETAAAAYASVKVDTAPAACELAEPSSVRACVAAVKKTGPLDAIICNAGIMALPRLTLIHGYEAQFFTNHIGHFMLVTGLLDGLAKNGRVVMVSSSAHMAAPRAGIEFDNLDGRKGYGAWKAYGQSKLANALFALELARRLKPGARVANSLHPGVIKTNLGRHMWSGLQTIFAAMGPLFLKTIAQGAATHVYVAAHPDTAAVSGEYFADCNIARPSARARDPELARRLWEESERIVRRLQRGDNGARRTARPSRTTTDITASPCSPRIARS